MNRLDKWWDEKAASRRYDHGPMYYCIMLACLFTSLSLIILGPTPGGAIDDLSADLQMILAWVLLVGSSISFFAANTGLRFWFPNWSRVLSYGIGLIGVPLVAASMIFYGYAVMASIWVYFFQRGNIALNAPNLKHEIDTVNYCTYPKQGGKCSS